MVCVILWRNWGRIVVCWWAIWLWVQKKPPFTFVFHGLTFDLTFATIINFNIYFDRQSYIRLFNLHIYFNWRYTYIYTYPKVKFIVVLKGTEHWRTQFKSLLRKLRPWVSVMKVDDSLTIKLRQVPVTTRWTPFIRSWIRQLYRDAK